VRAGAGSLGRGARWALATATVVYGLTAIGVATRHGATTTLAGRSAVAATVELAAGWCVAAAGVLTWIRRPGRPAGPLALAAGAAWFAGDWVGWQTGPGAVRIVALGAASVAAAAVVQLTLGAPGGVAAPGLARAVVAAAWVVTTAAVVGRVLAYDPLADPDCRAYCAPNPLLVHGDRTAATVLGALEVAMPALATVAVGALVVRRLRRAQPAERAAVWPVALPGVAFLAATPVAVVALAADPGADPGAPALVVSFACRAIALAALAAGLAWATERTLRGARTIRRLAREIAGEAGAGLLQAELARTTGDPSLRVAYPLGDGERWIDSAGLPVAAPARDDGRAVTAIAREGRTVAAVVHDPAALDALALEREIGTVARLAVDNERLRAVARARLRELRASRVRIVETGDAERRRLERDLHDGAQQRLVGLAVGLGMARAAVDEAHDPRVAARLEDAGASLRAAIVDLRELAHGMHPVELTEEGLAAAVATRAARARVPLRVVAMPDKRLPVAVETAAHVLVDEAVARAERRPEAATIRVEAEVRDGVLAVAVDDPGDADTAGAARELAGVADRIVALDGRLDVGAAPDGGVHIRAEIPCG
jgi:signal transduction histidine kinase